MLVWLLWVREGLEQFAVRLWAVLVTSYFITRMFQCLSVGWISEINHVIWNGSRGTKWSCSTLLFQYCLHYFQNWYHYVNNHDIKCFRVYLETKIFCLILSSMTFMWISTSRIFFSSLYQGPTVVQKGLKAVFSLVVVSLNEQRSNDAHDQHVTLCGQWSGYFVRICL